MNQSLNELSALWEIAVDKVERLECPIPVFFPGTGIIKSIAWCRYDNQFDVVVTDNTGGAWPIIQAPLTFKLDAVPLFPEFYKYVHSHKVDFYNSLRKVLPQFTQILENLK